MSAVRWSVCFAYHRIVTVSPPPLQFLVSGGDQGCASIHQHFFQFSPSMAFASAAPDDDDNADGHLARQSSAGKDCLRFVATNARR